MIAITKLEDVETLTHDTDPNFGIYDSDGVAIKFNGSTAKLETENTDLDAMIAAIKGEDGMEFVVVTNNQTSCNSDSDMEPNKRNDNITVKMETEDTECICPIDIVEDKSHVDVFQQPQVIKKTIARKLTTLQYKKVVSRTLKNGKTNSKLEKHLETVVANIRARVHRNKRISVVVDHVYTRVIHPDKPAYTHVDAVIDDVCMLVTSTLPQIRLDNTVDTVLSRVLCSDRNELYSDTRKQTRKRNSDVSNKNQLLYYSKSIADSVFDGNISGTNDINSEENYDNISNAITVTKDDDLDTNTDSYIDCYNGQTVGDTNEVACSGNQDSVVLHNIQEPIIAIQTFKTVDSLNTCVNIVACNLCKCSIFGGINEAKSHIYDRHYSRKGYKCLLCNEIFSNFKDLRIHVVNAEKDVLMENVSFEYCHERIEKLLPLYFPELDTSASTGLEVSNINVESECSQAAADGAFDGCISETNDTICMNVGNNLISNAITTIKDGVDEKKNCDSFECSSFDLSCFSSSSVSFKYSISTAENEYPEVLHKSDLLSTDNDCCNGRADSSSNEMAIDVDNDDAGAADVSLHDNQATIVYNVQEHSEDIQEFSSIDLLNANINAVSCDLCKHPISGGVDEARSHIYKRHYMKNDGFKCVLCNKIFIHARRLNSHNCVAEHTTSTKITFKLCTESEIIEKLLTVCFPNLVQHMNISPPVPTTGNSTISMLNRGFRSKRKLKCTFCSTEHFPNTLHSLKHLKQALGICWLYKCLMCPYNTVYWDVCVRHCSQVHKICGQLWPGMHYMEIDELETIKFQCNKLAFPSYYAVC